jgi:hypothetical protein
LSDESKSQIILFIKEQVRQIREKYDKVMLGYMTVNEFWNFLAPVLTEFTGNKQYRDIIGKKDLDDLNRSRITLSTNWADYEESKNLGDDREVLQNKLKDKMRQVIDRLEGLKLEDPKHNYLDNHSRISEAKSPSGPNKISHTQKQKPPSVIPLFRSKYFLMATGGTLLAILFTILILYPRPEPIGFQPPIAEDQTVNTWENKAVFIGLKAVDSNGPLSYYISSYPRNGKISEFNFSTGRLIYTPALNYIGNDNFTFVAKNSKTDKSDRATVSIVIKRLIQNESIESNIISDNITPGSPNKKEVISLKYKSTLIPEQLRSPNLKSFTHGVTVEINATKPIMEKIANVTYFGKEGFTTLTSNQEVSNSPTDNFRISFNALEGFPLYAKVYFKDNHVQNLTTNIVLK